MSCRSWKNSFGICIIAKCEQLSTGCIARKDDYDRCLRTEEFRRRKDRMKRVEESSGERRFHRSRSSSHYIRRRSRSRKLRSKSRSRDRLVRI